MLSVSPSVLYKWRGRKLAYLKIGKSIRFLLADIESFIETNRITPQKDFQYDIKKIRLIKDNAQKKKIREILSKVSRLSKNRGVNAV